MTYVIVKDGFVINAIKWDGTAEWKPEDGDAVIADGDVGIGWTYDGKKFTSPTIPAKTQDENIADATATRDALRRDADLQILPLKYANELNDATDDERSSLLKWKAYVVALNRINLSSAPDIKWPDIPSY